MYASKVQVPDLYSLLRRRQLRAGLVDSRRVCANQKRRPLEAATVDRLQTPDRTDLRAKLLPVPRRKESDGTIAPRQPRAGHERRRLRPINYSRRRQTKFVAEANSGGRR